MTWLLAAYPWVKALHVVSMVAWMAGLLYLPRLFVYHATARVGSEVSETFKVMERRLLRGIMNPALIATFAFGILLLLTPGVVDWSRGWIYVKLGCVVALILIHHRLAVWGKDFAADANRQPARVFRIVNEVPTLLLIIIVVMVAVKPF